ncbi:ribonuclease domain-containing protein [Mycolicibacterium hodleri]|uniref:ribonuclease domain-containing protein n=1 Tax=Mycolicibacterium hodleri TaxID=49897 RepID=UPI001F1DB822|nr:ribonuclease domain-containing protein [Mycolicibacterium hodleri]
MCALIVVVAGWALLRPNPSLSDPASTVAGVSTCRLSTLPPQVAVTVRLIQTDGPFPFPRTDGVVFGNREGQLPEQAKGYYHEYTVITPGASNRSTRRIVTGGSPLTDPPQYFYTGDHYDSFCVVPDVKARG